MHIYEDGNQKKFFKTIGQPVRPCIFSLRVFFLLFLLFLSKSFF